MKNYLFVDEVEDEIKYGKVENSNLVFYEKINKKGIQVGNIYRSRVLKKVASLNCYFVEIEKNTHGFLDFKDVIGDIKPGDIILVEVYKINSGEKAPNVTMNFSLSSDFAVMYFKNSKILISKKIDKIDIDLTKLEKLKCNFGLKLRTKVVEYDENIIFDDISILLKKMLELLKSLNELQTPFLVYKKDNQIKDYIIKNKKMNCIINNKHRYLKFKNDRLLLNNFKLDENYNVNYDYNIGDYISTFDKKFLNFDNINIVVENFEALTVIDVNSKTTMKYQDKYKNSFYVNKIAMKEILRQISFRNISGIILVDLINMNKLDKINFEKYMKEIKIEDGKIWNFYGFTKTGLYEITRQRGINGSNR